MGVPLGGISPGGGIDTSPGENMKPLKSWFQTKSLRPGALGGGYKRGLGKGMIFACRTGILVGKRGG